MRLEEVIGQPQVTEPLIGALKAGKINHAYLFVGPRGCGKTSVARILAHEINGFPYETEDDYVDIIEIDGASNRGIDNIRELREKVMIAPTIGKYKVYIIDEVHMLTKEAFNALLKTLEEPPKHAVFILATTDAYKVPVTITSRTQVYTFRLADEGTMLSFLSNVAEKEGIRIDKDALLLIAQRGGGSFRDSLSLLDQISALPETKISKDDVVKALGLPHYDQVAALMQNYASNNYNDNVELLRNLFNSGIKAETIVEELIRQIIAKPQPELLELLTKLSDIKPPYIEAKLLVALLYGSSSAISSNAPPRQVKPAPKATSAPLNTALPASQHDGFDWQQFVNKVQSLNDAVYTQLVKTEHELRDDELLIYPKRGIVKTILSRETNKRILINAAGNVKITICDVNDTPSGAKQDETLSKISAIMGGEVRNDGGTSPF